MEILLFPPCKSFFTAIVQDVEQASTGLFQFSKNFLHKNLLYLQEHNLRFFFKFEISKKEWLKEMLQP